MGVTALAVLARIVEALLYVVVARGSAEAGGARALIRVLERYARRAVPTRHRRAVVLQLAVRPCNTTWQAYHNSVSSITHSQAVLESAQPLDWSGGNVTYSNKSSLEGRLSYFVSCSCFLSFLDVGWKAMLTHSRNPKRKLSPYKVGLFLLDLISSIFNARKDTILRSQLKIKLLQKFFRSASEKN